MRIGERVLPELSQDSSNNIAREKGAVAVGGAGSGAGLLAFGNSEHSATRACHLWPSPGHLQGRLLLSFTAPGRLRPLCRI